MTQTFDTSRVGGCTYELEQDANGNYKLKSVGFAQVNKLNLPDLKTSDTPVQKILPVEDEKKTEVADPYKKLFKQTEDMGRGGGQDYSGVTLKTPEVKDAEVRQAGDAMTKDAQSTRQNFDQSVSDMQASAGQNYNKALQDFQAAKGGSPAILSDARANLGNARKELDQAYGFGDNVTTPYQDAITRGQVGVKAGSITPERVTDLQKVRSKVTGLKTDIGNIVSKSFAFNAIKGAAKGLGTVLGGVGKAVFGPETNSQVHARGYFNVSGTASQPQRIAGNPAENVFAGANANAKDLDRVAQKRIDTITKNLAAGKYKDPDKKREQLKDFKDQQRDYRRDRVTKTAKRKGLDTSNPNEMRQTDGGGDSSPGGNTRVICTDLHRTKELSTRDWIRDTKFTFKTLSIKHVKGYLLWAEPTVRHIQKYPRYRKIWKHIAQHRANDIAWRLNEGKFDLLGRIYAGIGEPVCWALGNFVSDKQISKYNLTHWRRA